MPANPMADMTRARNAENDRLILIGQCTVLLERAKRGLPLDPRSLRNLARHCVEVAEWLEP